jgi:hypothetical protein
MTDRKRGESHKLDVPCPVDRMRTLCGVSLKSTRMKGHAVALLDEAVDCEECLRWMRCRGYVVKPSQGEAG